jgi:hypothetical protein
VTEIPGEIGEVYATNYILEIALTRACANSRGDMEVRASLRIRALSLILCIFFHVVRTISITRLLGLLFRYKSPKNTATALGLLSGFRSF